MCNASHYFIINSYLLSLTRSRAGSAAMNDLARDIFEKCKETNELSACSSIASSRN